MSCNQCKNNCGVHLCNFCSGHIILNDNEIVNMLSIIYEKNIMNWLLSFCYNNNEDWQDSNTNMGLFFSDRQIDIQKFNGCNLKCIIMRLKWEAMQMMNILID